MKIQRRSTDSSNAASRDFGIVTEHSGVLWRAFDALDTLIAAHSDAAVKSALADLLNASGVATPTRTWRNRP
jgi:hypothetical protein